MAKITLAATIKVCRSVCRSLWQALWYDDLKEYQRARDLLKRSLDAKR